MSEDLKKTKEEPVETVENFEKTNEVYFQSLEEIEDVLNDIISLIKKWKLENRWPMNLVIDALNHVKVLIIGLYQFL